MKLISVLGLLTAMMVWPQYPVNALSTGLSPSDFHSALDNAYSEGAVNALWAGIQGHLADRNMALVVGIVYHTYRVIVQDSIPNEQIGIFLTCLRTVDTEIDTLAFDEGKRKLLQLFSTVAQEYDAMLFTRAATFLRRLEGKMTGS
ncbi:hypothetical protein H4R34_005603 [Dimargaris verticillata]|uniref:Uncharacterized protein n=1 Tax=Dimargaris verticillata TaxID=2761393 RepID=A0A9W8AXW0_9FUNG|nr:hypothetical protein H4R34_005603 [Dimargaris verticillata]